MPNIYINGVNDNTPKVRLIFSTATFGGGVFTLLDGSGTTVTNNVNTGYVNIGGDITTDATLTDTRLVKVGLQYGDNYYSDFTDRSLIDKGYVDVEVEDLKVELEELIYEAGTAGQYYYGASPATVTIGGISSGTVIFGKTYTEIFEDMFTPYQLPAFTSASIVQSTPLEVGAPLTGFKTFNWAISNNSNVAANSIAIRDNNAATLIATGLANDGTESVDIGTITNTSPISQSWRIEGTNTEAGAFNSSNITVTSIYPYFYGKVSGSRPTADQSLINSGTKVVAASTGTLTVTYNSTVSDYIWFAVPSTSPTKTTWYVNALNTGAIGGSVDPGGNLFPDFDTVSIDSPSALWNGVNYEIYISNYTTDVVTIQFLN